MTLWEAESVENNNVVSSDDPDAVRKLKEKLQDLEARRQNIKDYNKLARKEGKEQAPAYVLQNLGGNIQRVKERIKALEARHGQESTEERAGDVRIISNVEANRVQIFFPDIPDQDTRSNLKRNGFRWSRRNGCWQRHLNNHAVWVAKNIIIGGE